MRWTCTRCGIEHVGLPHDWSFAAPVYWDGGNSGDDYLTEDLCVWTDGDGTTYHFIRGIIPIPVRDTGDVFAYGVWSSLSEQSFLRAREVWDDEERVSEPPYFGWLSNRLPGYPDTVSLQLGVVMRTVELRPSFVLLPDDHPLVDEQWRGITAERVREIAELNMHAG